MNKPDLSPRKVSYGTSTYMTRQSRLHSVPYTPNPHPSAPSALNTVQVPSNSIVSAVPAGSQATPTSRACVLASSTPDVSSQVVTYHRSYDTYRPWSQKYVALHDYAARVEDDLSMVKGQQFYVMDRSQGYWWYAKCVATGKTGYVPFNYLAPVTSLESNE